MRERRKGLLQQAVFACVLMALGCLPPALTHAQQPDNSGVNKREHPTADSQSSHRSDREITAQIRRGLMADKQLSVYGHNVKIITRNGAVTLKGPVHSAEEKQAIATRATNVAGEGKVTDQLTVKQ